MELKKTLNYIFAGLCIFSIFLLLEFPIYYVVDFGYISIGQLILYGNNILEGHYQGAGGELFGFFSLLLTFVGSILMIIPKPKDGKTNTYLLVASICLFFAFIINALFVGSDITDKDSTIFFTFTKLVLLISTIWALINGISKEAKNN